MARKLYERIANLVSARANCLMRQMQSMADEHADTIEKLCEEHLPSGSGFDNGTSLDLDASSEEKLVFTAAFHHMDEHGYYDGWTEHRIYITPSLIRAFNMRITGKDRNGIKEYIGDCFANDLKKDCE